MTLEPGSRVCATWCARCVRALALENSCSVAQCSLVRRCIYVCISTDLEVHLEQTSTRDEKMILKKRDRSHPHTRGDLAAAVAVAELLHDAQLALRGLL